MKIINVIESKVLVNKHTGLKVSPYGAVPWTNDAQKNDWELITQGYTWELDNGRIGLGIVPAKTYEEAIVVMDRFNNRS